MIVNKPNQETIQEVLSENLQGNVEKLQEYEKKLNVRMSTPTSSKTTRLSLIKVSQRLTCKKK